MHIFLFSFNRGDFLRNCLNSIEQCAGEFAVTIVDDHSFDARTFAVLRWAEARCEVIRPPRALGSDAQTGGLSNSMMHALELSRVRNYRRVLLIQDDMQLVRPIKPLDLEMLDRYFAANHQSIQLQTCFIRKLSEKSAALHHFRDESGTALMRRSPRPRSKDHFSDVGVFDVGRFFEMMGTLAVGEGENSDLARSKGIVMGRALSPFMNWLPYPSSLRNRGRDLKHRITEAVSGAGFHPIELMTEEAAERFTRRDPSVLPIAEHFLHSPSSPRHDVWSTGGGAYNLIARGGWRAMMFQAGTRIARPVRRPSAGRQSGGSPQDGTERGAEHPLRG